MQSRFDFQVPVPAPYQRHSGTSYEAAERIAPSASSLRGMVLAYLRSRGEHGATDEEGQAKLCLDGNTYRPRRVELARAGFVRMTGQTRKTSAGRAASVWVVT